MSQSRRSDGPALLACTRGCSALGVSVHPEPRSGGSDDLRCKCGVSGASLSGRESRRSHALSQNLAETKSYHAAEAHALAPHRMLSWHLPVTRGAWTGRQPRQSPQTGIIATASTASQASQL